MSGTNVGNDGRNTAAGKEDNTQSSASMINTDDNSNSIDPSSNEYYDNQIKALQETVNLAQQQVNNEKAGKRKLFHSLVKLADELRKMKNEMKPYLIEQQFLQQNWYDGGLWRSPQILPNIKGSSVRFNYNPNNTTKNNNSNSNNNNYSQRVRQAQQQRQQLTALTNPARREAVSLSDLFFNLVIVTAFTRVGVSISQIGYLDYRCVLYFGIFWTVWTKESSYGTRFDTSDLSAACSTLVTCFAVLFASLSVQAPIDSDDGTRIMMMALFVAGLNCLLHIRVAYTTYYNDNTNDQQPQSEPPKQLLQRGPTPLSPAMPTPSPFGGGEGFVPGATSRRPRSDSYASGGGGNGVTSLNQHVIKYAVFNIVMTCLECMAWSIGIFVFPVHWEYRPYIFLIGFIFALRIPRAFLANDFHAACSRRGVLFILLLGFLLQSIVVVASEFFEYQTPTLEHYSFIGAACLMFFCIKLLYVDDSGTVAEDHALLVNRWAGFFFNIGQFSLLLSTTVMGSGLNLLTHEYLAATAALPGPAKTLVCGGFSAVLFSTFFIKSMHVKRVPTDTFNQALFVGAYIIQAVVLLLVVGVTAAMSLGYTNPFFDRMMQYDSVLLFVLSGSALMVVAMGWLDEGVELMLYESAADSRAFRVHPFGIWWCLAPDVTTEELDDNAEDMLDNIDMSQRTSRYRLSVLSPLLGSSIANMKEEFGRMSSASLTNVNYQSV